MGRGGGFAKKKARLNPPFHKNGAENIGSLWLHTNRVNGTLHEESKPKLAVIAGLSAGDPYGNRTHIFAVRGRRLSRLTKGPCLTDLDIIPHLFRKCNRFFKKIYFLSLLTIIFICSIVKMVLLMKPNKLLARLIAFAFSQQPHLSSRNTLGGRG